MWVLVTYAERIDNDYPNKKHVLNKSLKKSLRMVEKMFPTDDFEIIVRNILDFRIKRLEDGENIGEIEYDERWYEEKPLLKDYGL